MEILLFLIHIFYFMQKLLIIYNGHLLEWNKIVISMKTELLHVANILIFVLHLTCNTWNNRAFPDFLCTLVSFGGSSEVRLLDMRLTSSQQPQATKYNFNCPQLLGLLKACHENCNLFLSLIAGFLFSPLPRSLELSFSYVLFLVLCMVRVYCLYSCNPNGKVY